MLRQANAESIGKCAKTREILGHSDKNKKTVGESLKQVSLSAVDRVASSVSDVASSMVTRLVDFIRDSASHPHRLSWAFWDDRSTGRKDLLWHNNNVVIVIR